MPWYVQQALPCQACTAKAHEMGSSFVAWMGQAERCLVTALGVHPEEQHKFIGRASMPRYWCKRIGPAQAMQSPCCYCPQTKGLLVAGDWGPRD